MARQEVIINHLLKIRHRYENSHTVSSQCLFAYIFMALDNLKLNRKHQSIKLTGGYLPLDKQKNQVTLHMYHAFFSLQQFKRTQVTLLKLITTSTKPTSTKNWPQLIRTSYEVYDLAKQPYTREDTSQNVRRHCSREVSSLTGGKLGQEQLKLKGHIADERQ